MTAEFSIAVRVYIEDTDAGGIVYHANYLRFLERARTELLRSLGFDKPAMPDSGVMFVVHAVDLAYHRPARLDDDLKVTVAVDRCAGAALCFRQRVCRDGLTLVEGAVGVAAVNPDSLRPVRLPRALRAALANYAA